ncbi:MAG: Uma2 family endonuclease [Planctomycetales bacterium]
MSTTIPETIAAQPEQEVRSRRGEPTWEMAYLYPYQGDWSEEDYLALDVGRIVEFTDGVVEFLPMPNLTHQDIMLFLRDLLKAYVEQRNLGRVYVAPSPVRMRHGKYREPDVFFLRHERIKSRKTPPDGADLVMEVVSEGESSRIRDLVEKRQDYAEAGIPEYWVIDPEEKKIVVFALDGDQYRTHGEFAPGQTAASRLLPGFEVAVAQVFAAGEDSK